MFSVTLCLINPLGVIVLSVERSEPRSRARDSLLASLALQTQRAQSLADLSGREVEITSQHCLSGASGMRRYKRLQNFPQSPTVDL